MKSLISIVGPTGIGKTSLAIGLAGHFGTEIISCDSRQFFREMKIGTAAPSLEELSAAKHHFIGSRSVAEPYSIGQFEADALQKLEEIFPRNPVAIMVGGSTMYEKAVTEGLHDLPEADEVNQQKLSEILKSEGLEKLLLILHDIDYEYFSVVDRQNPRRILRAIDVIWQTGEKYSELISKPKQIHDFQTIRIGIQAPREIIYERINRRVDKMLETGLIGEVKSLVRFRDQVALKTVGYTEIFNYLDGIWPLEFAVSEIKKNSRRFAKRQLTWYRGEHNIHWVPFENALQESLSLLRKLNFKP